MALKWKSMRLSMAGSVTCPPSWKRSHRSPSLCILMPIFNRTVRSQIRRTRVFVLKAPEKWCELWTFTLSKPSKYWLMNFHVWMKCSIETLCVFPVSRWKRKTHTKDRFYADFKKILTCSHMRAMGLFTQPLTIWAPRPTVTPREVSSHTRPPILSLASSTTTCKPMKM